MLTIEDHAILRDVALDPFIPGHLPRPFRLTVWDTYTRDHYGKSRLGYRMVSPEGIVLFESEDFCCSPCVAVDSDDMLRSLLGFLTLQEGDIEAEYFDDYSAEARAFAASDACEALSIYAMEPEEGEEVEDPFLDWED